MWTIIRAKTFTLYGYYDSWLKQIIYWSGWNSLIMAQWTLNRASIICFLRNIVNKHSQYQSSILNQELKFSKFFYPFCQSNYKYKWLWCFIRIYFIIVLFNPTIRLLEKQNYLITIKLTCLYHCHFHMCVDTAGGVLCTQKRVEPQIRDINCIQKDLSGLTITQ